LCLQVYGSDECGDLISLPAATRQQGSLSDFDSQGNYADASRPQDHMGESGESCSDGGVGNALIHHSTIAECDHTHASYVDTHFARHSQVASQGTGAVNVRIADMAMY
jgi:hypothetical protein